MKTNSTLFVRAMRIIRYTDTHMKQDSLITLPNPHLRQISKKVGYIDEEIQELIKRMEAITLDWESSREHEVSVALAAIQIDAPIRIVIIRNDFDNKKDKTFHALLKRARSHDDVVGVAWSRLPQLGSFE